MSDFDNFIAHPLANMFPMIEGNAFEELRQINELATQYLHDHPECWRAALTQAHRIDDKEGVRKARQRLRREQLRKIRSSPSVT